MTSLMRIAVVHVDPGQQRAVRNLIAYCRLVQREHVVTFDHGCQAGTTQIVDGLDEFALVIHHCGLGKDAPNAEYGDAVRGYLQARPSGAVVLFSGYSSDVTAARHAFGGDSRVTVEDYEWLRIGLYEYLTELLADRPTPTSPVSDRTLAAAAALDLLSALSVYHLSFAAKPTDGQGALRHAADDVISSAPASPDFEQAVEMALGNAIVHGHDQHTVASALANYPETERLTALLAAHSWTSWTNSAGVPPSTLAAVICGLSSCGSFDTWQRYVLGVREALMTGEGRST